MLASHFVMPNTVIIPTSIGDLIDRITILKIKSDRIKNQNQLKHIKIELNLLLSPYHTIKDTLAIDTLERQLMAVNAKLWDYEDLIRAQSHDADIAKTARAIIKTNDLRSAIKYEINFLFHSQIVEVKSYTPQQETGSNNEL